METFGCLGCQHFPPKRFLCASWDLSILLWEEFPGTWSIHIHLSQSNQRAMDGIPSSAAHHPHSLIASSWLSIKTKPDFAFRDGRTEEGFVPSPCYLDVFWGVSVTSSEQYKSSHMDQESSQQHRQTKGSLSTHPEEDYSFLALL